ncbi:hypothetical protein [Methylophaga sp.]|uniref:hypothetical protein n=1 Tax=Methylophaga sp. TaxID=2024840 RepID=UPI003F6A006D
MMIKIPIIFSRLHFIEANIKIFEPERDYLRLTCYTTVYSVIYREETKMKLVKSQSIRASIAFGLSGLFLSAVVSAVLPPHYVHSVTLATDQGINTNLVVH